MKSHLEALVTRYIALIQLQDYIAKSAKDSPATHAPLIDTLNVYNEKIDFANLVPVKSAGKGGVEPVPVKPVFFDIAWNFVQYPAKEEKKIAEVKKADEAAPKKGGFLGLWGR